jgi:hypothetical protein
MGWGSGKDLVAANNSYQNSSTIGLTSMPQLVQIGAAGVNRQLGFTK